MKQIKLVMTFLMAMVLFAVVVHAQSDKGVQPKKAIPTKLTVQSKDKVEPKQATPVAPEIKPAPVSIPQRVPLTGSRQGYKLVRDVLDGFGGESESDNYKIPINSGGQPSAIGISESDIYMLKAGYLYSSSARRGDVTSDGVIDLGDVVYLISYLYRAGPEPCPMEADDLTLDGVVDVGDVVYLISYLFRDGPPPPC